MNKDRESAKYRERVFAIVRRIPRGRVMTYGQIAVLLDNAHQRYTPRTIGFVLHSITEEDKIPWHRVINSRGECSTTKILLPSDKQQRLLEAEGIVFSSDNRCDLESLRWQSKKKQSHVS